MDVQEAKAVFRGSTISVATPFTEDFELDLDALRENIRFMLDRGVKRGNGLLLVAAAGGEFPMLSFDERLQVIEASVEVAAGEIEVAASIQFNGTREAVEFARRAHEAGASLGQLSSPYYYPPPEKDIFRFFKAVSDDSDLPIMVYNNWWNTPNMNVDTVDRLAELPNVVALKWSAPNSGQYSEGLHRLADRLAIIDNNGQVVWSNVMGAVGFVTHVSNFWPEYPLAIWQALEQGDYPKVAQVLGEFQFVWQAWRKKVEAETEGEGPFIKAAMEGVGLPAGPPRPPAARVSAGLREAFRELAEETGIPRAAAPVAA